MADDQILDVVQDLTRADLEAAWDYVARNRDEIERVIRENESDEE